MKKFAWFKNGRLVVGSKKPIGISDFIEVDKNFTPQTHYIKNGQPVEYPPRPSEFCHFDFEAEQWIEDMDAHWRNLRRERNASLAATDWTQVPDAPVDAAVWATYRQALRDLPTNTDDPRCPTWPTPPT